MPDVKPVEKNNHFPVFYFLNYTTALPRNKTNLQFNICKYHLKIRPICRCFSIRSTTQFVFTSLTADNQPRTLKIKIKNAVEELTKTYLAITHISYILLS